MDPGVRHQVGLEFSQINIQGTIETERSSDGGDNLTNEPVEVGVGRSLDVKVPTADVIDGFIVNHESTVRVLKSSMSGQDGIVGFNHSSGNLGSRVDRELQLGLLAIINRETFHEERGESRSGATTEGVEQEETLESRALISQLTNTVQNQIDNLFANGVVSSSIVVSSIFLSSDQLFGVKQLTVSSSSYFINDSRLQINEDSSGYMLSRSSFSKEGGERIISSHQLVGGHLTIGLDAMLQAVEFPACVTDLATSLTNMDRDTFTLQRYKDNC